MRGSALRSPATVEGRAADRDLLVELAVVRRKRRPYPADCGFRPSRFLGPVRYLVKARVKPGREAPLLAAITSVVRETSMRVLLCPEDESQMEITRVMLWDRLPDDVRRRVVWRKTFWLPDEAATVYQNSAGLFGHEMHSPIMCLGRGIPAIVCRWSEQSTKGIMWRDIGLDDWLFDLDLPEEAEKVAPAVLALARSPDSARTLAELARKLVEARFRETMTSTVAGFVVTASMVQPMRSEASTRVRVA